MTYQGLQLYTALLTAQFDFIDWFLNLIFSAFGLIFVLFIAIFVGIFIFAFYMICKSMRSAVKDIDTVRSIPISEPTHYERQLLRESLPPECPHCDAPLKYNEVKWVGPHRAECPYCGKVVELELREVTDPDD
ncbi:MAG: hypothetical protein ACFFD8_05075 [Candidatus Thorarchaeota archaeon]